MQPGPPSLDATLELERYVARFEAAWQAGQRPDLEKHLPAEEPLRRLALVEMAHADLEYRLKAGEPARVEEYLKRFPELAENGAALLDLLAHECQLRLRQEPGLGLAEYRRRFPQLDAPLAYEWQRRDLPVGDDLVTLTATLQPGMEPAVLVSDSPGPPPGSAQRYRILRPHVKGGLGEIFVAEDQELHREVALKELQRTRAHDGTSRSRFLLEAEITGKLEHPGIVPVYGLGQYADGRLFYAMRFVRGENLREAIKHFHAADGPSRDPAERNLALRQLLRRFVDVCNAVDYAHSRGVLHRDIKPANVLLGKYGETLLVDWGLAKPFSRSEEARATGEETLAPSAESTEEPTAIGTALGTPAYMSPEQALGHWDQVGPASDVYGLGATLYTLLTGEPPFRESDPRVVAVQIKLGGLRRPREVKPGVPRALEAVCLRAMAEKPRKRYPSARALADDVESWLADQPVSAYTESAWERLGRWGRLHRALVTASTLAAFVVLVTVTTATLLVARWWGQASRLTAENARLALTRTFDGELERRDWSEAHLQRLDELAAELARIAPDEAAAARARLADRFAAWIGDTIRDTPRLQAAQGERLADAIRRLAERDPERAVQLQERLAHRLHIWEPLADLKPPYGDLATVFDAAQVIAEVPEGGRASLRRADEGRPGEPVVTRILCRPNAQLECIFPAGGWNAGPEVGLILNYEPGPGAPVTALAVSVDGSTIACGQADGMLSLWERGGTQRAVLNGHTGPVRALAFSPDGKLLASGGTDHAVRLWDVEVARSRAELSLHTGEVLALAFDANRLVSAGADGKVLLWDLASERPRATFTVSRSVRFVALGPGPGSLVTVSEDLVARIWDLAAGKERSHFAVSASSPTSLALTPDGRKLAAWGNRNVQLWDVASGQMRPLFEVHDPVTLLALTPDGSRLSGTVGRKASLWDAESGRSVASLEGHVEEILAVAFAPDGKSLFTAGADRTIREWDPLGQPRHTIQRRGYRFLVQRPAGGNGQALRLQILRNEVLLRELAVSLEDGALTLRARREGDTLTFQVNEQPPVVFQEVFPLGRAEAGIFALAWPAGNRLERLHASSPGSAGTPSGLERGDLLLAAGRFGEALVEYERQAQAATESALVAEARCKEAFCQLRLGHDEEAARLFSDVRALAPANERWWAAASCQLWLIRLRQKRLEEANAVLADLYGQYTFRQLAPYISEDQRLAILKTNELLEQHSPYEWIKHDATRIPTLERVATIEEVFGASEVTRARTKLRLVMAYEAAGQEEKGLPLLKEVLAVPGLPAGIQREAIEGLAEYHARRGAARQALELINQRLVDPSGGLRPALWPLLAVRARVHGMAGAWDEGLYDIDDYLKRCTAGGIEDDGSALEGCLLKGFLLEGKGDATGARRVWTEGFQRARRTPALLSTLAASMLGSLSDQVTEADAWQTVEGVARRSPGFRVVVFAKSLLFPVKDLAQALRGMWQTRRGHEYARKAVLGLAPRMEAFRAQVLLSVAEFIHLEGFPGPLSAEHEDFIWQLVNHLMESHQAGQLGEDQLVKLTLAWFWAGDVRSWDQNTAKLPPGLRAELSYAYGHRYRLLGKPRESQAFFRTVVASTTDASLRRLAQAELERSKAAEGAP
jgi:tRNA A-37 threonylcarbamoyl transferase component Bud32